MGQGGRGGHTKARRQVVECPSAGVTHKVIRKDGEPKCTAGSRWATSGIAICRTQRFGRLLNTSSHINGQRFQQAHKDRSLRGPCILNLLDMTIMNRCRLRRENHCNALDVCFWAQASRSVSAKTQCKIEGIRPSNRLRWSSHNARQVDRKIEQRHIQRHRIV